MVVIKENGYFEEGLWKTGMHSSLIGKKIIRLCPITLKGECGKYIDYSYSRIGKYFPQSDYVILRKLYPDGSFEAEWNPRLFPGYISKYKSEWNDGNWVEYKEEVN